jgi:hypothetical protein
MGALDQLLANNQQSSTPQGSAPLAPRVQQAQRSLATQTKKIAAQAKASPKAKGKLDSILGQAEQIKQGKTGGGGWSWSLNPLEDVGMIAHNVPGVEGVLTALDTPRAFVASGVNQLANTLDFSDKQGFDPGQLVSDAAEHKGIGQYFQEQLARNAAQHGGKAQLFGMEVDPNNSKTGLQKWLQRGLGLVGDVASDPLTYLSAGVGTGVGEVSRTAGVLDRVELAKRLASQAERGVPGITDETIAAVGRKGVTGLAPELQKQLGLRPTLAIGGQAIPGTDKLAAATRALTGKVREVAGDTVLGRGARAVAATPAERGLMEQVVKGGAEAASSAKALESIDQAKAVARQFGVNRGTELKNILKSIPKHEMAQIPGLLESGVTTGSAGKVRQWLDDVLVEANAKGANLGSLNDYYPHALTPKAAEALAEKGVVQRGTKGTAVGPELLRKYKPGEDFLGTTLAKGDIGEINDIAKQKLGYDLFNPKPAEVLPNYLSAVQRAVERGSYADRQVAHGVGKEIAGGAAIPKDYRVISKGTTKTVEPDWLAETRTVEKALPPAEKRAFLAGWDRFTQLWKAGATFSPGFHVRNAYSGVFNNFVAGVKSDAYTAYHSLARRAEKGTLRSAEDRATWDYVQKAVEATGNPFDPAEIGKAALQPKHGKIISAPGKVSRAAGNSVENHLRGTMALDSYRAGEDLTSAINRIERFHFNYADISPVDKWAKRVIPFWMFTSRNLPLQAQMMLRRPNAYTKFLALQRNLSMGVAPDQVVPSYFGEQMAIPTDISLPGGEGTKYLAPDLPFLRVNKDLEMLTDPVRLLSQANPLIKVPAEMLAGRKLYNDAPFTNTPQPLPHGDLLSKIGVAQLLEGLGLAEQGADGPMITDEQLNTLESLVPVAGRARRLAPDEDLMNQRFGTSLASFLGLSSLTNSPSAQAGELARRKRALEAFLKEQQGLGYIAKPEQKKVSHPFGKKG